MKFEGYIPKREDVSKATESMTEEQSRLSNERLAELGKSYNAKPAEKFEPLYTGAFISNDERGKLSELFPPEHIKNFLHHMTFAFSPSPDEAYALPIGQEIELQVIGIAQDERGQALVLESPFPTRGVPHITVSTAEGTGAVYSNELITTKGFVALEKPISIRARVGYGDRGNNISFDITQEVYTSEERARREREALESRFLGTLKTGERIFDRTDSHIHDSGTLEKHLPIVLSRIEKSGEDFIAQSVDMGETIGTTSCVETINTDEIVYAQRVGRTGLTRFVKGRDPQPTTSITVALKRIKEGFILLTAYVGSKAEVEPWDPRATSASTEFWNTHALVWGSEPIIPNTETQSV